MKLQTLYTKTSTGATQEWTIEVTDNKYRTMHGQTNGKIQTSVFTIAYGKNPGKKNATTDAEQALKEAQATWQKKIDKGYTTDINNIDAETFFEPMLANKWEDYKDQALSEWKLAIQPKLDGIRCVISTKGMFTRNGKPIIACPHIFNSLTTFLKKYPNIILDGELYNHDLKFNFNKIVSLVKQSKPTADDIKEAEKMIEFHCYDMFDKDNVARTFDNRIDFIADNLYHFSKYVRIVDTHNVKSEKELDKIYANFVEIGYEGGIIRNLGAAYENKRTKQLLKRKDFIDSEFKILDIVEGEGNRTGMAGYMNFQTDDNKPFKSNVKGNFEYLADVLKNKNKLIGKLATIKYFSLTPDGIPRFPYVTSIRDYE